MRYYSELTCTFETKSANDDTATFTGIASTSDTDSDNDVIAAGAFDPIAMKATGEPDVLMLRDHDRTQVVGGWKSFTQQGSQLVVEGELCLQVAKARETYALLKRGFLSGLSVGFSIPDRGAIKLDNKSGRRTITKATLKECSIVALPANQGARVTGVKSEDMLNWLRTCGLPSEDVELLMREGLEALIAARKEKTPEKPYGDVQYADPGYQEDGKKRYPIDTEGHIRSAWNFINKPSNRTFYSSEQLDRIEARIVAAWKRVIDSKGPPSAKDEDDNSVILGIDDCFPIDEAAVAEEVRALLTDLKGYSHGR
jgi:HK97 family phage prohead protease